jgi:muconolactone delta-isomerase
MGNLFREMELEALLDALPLCEWMPVTITPLDRHPNDPAGRDGA